MPRRKYDARVYALAKRGAEVQFRDLLHEAKLLINLFPHLRDAFDKDELPIQFIIRRGAGMKTTGRRTNRMSAASRKAVSVRMKKYWATRRKAAAKK
jgi:hypothetical protein